MIKGVFKAVAICIIIFVLCDMTMLAIDRVLVNSRIDALARMVTDEMSRHNSVPQALYPLIDAEVRGIAEKSLTTKEIKWNYAQSITDRNGITYERVDSSNIKNYGESMTLVFAIDYSMHSFVFSTPNSPSANELKKVEVNMPTQFKTYDTYALRTLK